VAVVEQTLPVRASYDVDVDAELDGLDILDVPITSKRSLGRRFWAAAWPKLLAVGLVAGGWQIVVWSGWKPEYILPSPLTVADRFVHDLGRSETWQAVATTLQRAGIGFALALAIGAVVGLGVARLPVLRAAIGSLVTGLQTMPSIVWFPLAIVLFQLSEKAILFVVVIGAAPSIANGIVSGVDHIPPVLRRAGRSMGARGPASWRHIVIPAALPSVVGGLKQGWSFAWRSLMAGELLGVVANKTSIGWRLEVERQFADYVGLYSVMLLVLLIGVVVDAFVFGAADRAVRRRWGLA
jgi:NitT/TauT family transport system permease protein